TGRRRFGDLCLNKLLLISEGSSSDHVSSSSSSSVSAVIMFGDSIVDTGNNNNNILSPARSNFPPYGRDFIGSKPTGRYSNGKVPSDLFGTIRRWQYDASSYTDLLVNYATDFI
ncbi:hypothetical protein F8388_013837, partial [Cannabis sativa]